MTTQGQTNTGMKLVNEWLSDAQASGLGRDWEGQHRHARYNWNAHLDVYVCSDRRPPRAILATARDVSQSGLAFFCRESLPAHTRVTICRSGERTGVAAKVLNRTQTLGGYILGVEFVVEQPARQVAVAVA